MSRVSSIASVLLGFLFGVLIWQFFQADFYWLILLAFFCFLVVYFLREKFHFYSIVILLFIAGICLGLARACMMIHISDCSDIDFYNGEKAEIEGVIIEADIRLDKAKYIVLITNHESRITNYSLYDDLVQLPTVSGKVLVTLDRYPQYRYGDRVRFTGKLKEPGEFDGFDYGNYLSRYGIFSVMYYPEIEFLSSYGGNWFWQGMTFLQNEFMERINIVFPEPYASFEAGLLTGSRKGIPDDLMEKFNITGLTHIIAISGYNITIIIVFVMAALKWLPRKIAFISAVISIILFTLFAGASSAVVRASIMGILGLFALNYGRQNNIHLTILFTAFFMVLWNPKILWWDVGFQLSFMAVLGLIYVAPLFDRYSEKLPETLGVREAIIMTIAAQVMALPIIVYNFERLSLISPIANLLVAFAIPFAMLFGFISVVFSFFFYGVSLFFGYIAWGILSYIIFVIEWTSKIPYASVDIPGMKIWMMAGYYLLIGVFLVYIKKRRCYLEV